jgi:hypothetical protein
MVILFILILVLLLYLMNKNKEQGKGYLGSPTDTAILMIGLTAAMLVFNKSKAKKQSVESKPPRPIIRYIPPPPQPDPERLDEPKEYEDPYDPYPWMGSPTYTSAYKPPPPFKAIGSSGALKCNINDYPNFDESNARLAALRQRDKRAMDGYVTKNANYYKRHFGRELEDAEKQQWWGNDEY